MARTPKLPTPAQVAHAQPASTTLPQPAAPLKGPASFFPSIEKTYGQPIAHWMGLLDSLQHLKHMEQVATLKTVHCLGHGHANALVAHHRGLRPGS